MRQPYWVFSRRTSGGSDERPSSTAFVPSRRCCSRQRKLPPRLCSAIYPGHLALAENSFDVKPDIRTHITRQTPPTFLLQNEDDDVDGVEQSLSYYAALKSAGVPVEMHLYAQGGHAFGLRRTKLPVTTWPPLVETWLGTIGMVPD